MLKTYIDHLLPPTKCGVCYTIFRETIALMLKNCMLFAVLLHRLCYKISSTPCFVKCVFLTTVFTLKCSLFFCTLRI